MIFVDELVYGLLATNTQVHQIVEGFRPLCWQGSERDEAWCGTLHDQVTCKDCLTYIHT
jgi:hypothetical protein